MASKMNIFSIVFICKILYQYRRKRGKIAKIVTKIRQAFVRDRSQMHRPPRPKTNAGNTGRELQDAPGRDLLPQLPARGGDPLGADLRHAGQERLQPRQGARR